MRLRAAVTTEWPPMRLMTTTRPPPMPMRPHPMMTRRRAVTTTELPPMRPMKTRRSHPMTMRPRGRSRPLRKPPARQRSANPRASFRHFKHFGKILRLHSPIECVRLRRRRRRRHVPVERDCVTFFFFFFQKSAVPFRVEFSCRWHEASMLSFRFHIPKTFCGGGAPSTHKHSFNLQRLFICDAAEKSTSFGATRCAAPCSRHHGTRHT